MANFNKVIIAGNLTRDPELKFLPSGTPVANFGLAMNEKFTDRETGETREKACFVDCEAWQRTAEIVGEYLTKGSPVLLEGKLQYDTWENDEGEKRSKLKIRVVSMQMLGSRNGADENGNGSESTAKSSAKPKAAEAKPKANTVEDDIPF